MKSDSITIYDLAREAGVSPATVSRVLNNTARVKQEKRDKVMALVQKYNFVPSAVAQGLSNKITKTIGVLMSDVRNPFYSTLYVGIETAASGCGYNTILCNALNDPDIEYQHLEMLESKMWMSSFCWAAARTIWSPVQSMVSWFSELCRKLLLFLPVNSITSILAG